MHANSTREVPARLEALAALGGMSRAALHSQLAAAVQVVLQVVRAPDGTRRLAEVAVLDRVDGELLIRPVWDYRHGGCDGRPALDAMLNERGVCPSW